MFECECIECGHKMESEKHCNTIKCPVCGGTMRRAERPGPGQKMLAIDWTKLIFGSYSADEIADAVDDKEWQDFRESLKGKTLEDKYNELISWMKKHRQAKKAKIQVTNYVNALARSGDIELAMCPAGWTWDEDSGKCVPKMSMSKQLYSDDSIMPVSEVPVSDDPCTIEDDLTNLITNLSEGEKVKILDKYGEEFTYFEMVEGTKRMLPYPNEHACRLRDPSQFDRFRRTSRRSNGKMYDVIWGIKDGKADEQAYRYPKDIWSAEQAKTHCRAHNGILFEPAKNASMTLWENVKPEELYVLSWDAINNDDIPPKGTSAIPKELEARIPDRFKWWTLSDEKARIDTRKAYKDATCIGCTIMQKYDDGRCLIECSLGEQYLVRFHNTDVADNEIHMSDVAERVTVQKLRVDNYTLMHHFWRLSKPVNGETTKQHWDIFIGGKQFVCVDNPIKQSTFAIVRKPYSVGFYSRGLNDYEYVEPGSPGNPSKNIPAWVKQLDSGTATVIEECGEHMLVWMKGYRLSGRYEFTFIKDKNVWEISKADAITVKLTKALSADESVYKSNIRMELSKHYMQGEDMIVEGTALSYGVWNGEYFPEDVIMDNPERLLGKPIAVGSHATKKNSGEVVELKAADGSIWIRGVIPKKNKSEQERVASGEFVGFSVEVDVIADTARRIIKKILGYDRAVLVDMPACVVCTLDKVRSAK